MLSSYIVKQHGEVDWYSCCCCCCWPSFLSTANGYFATHFQIIFLIMRTSVQ